MELPFFRYHPEPLKTGSIKPSDKKCVCCGLARGYIYVGPVYSVQELTESLCPWCIADGSAHKEFGAEFTDSDGVGGYGDWDDVEIKIIEEVCFRTPGFSGWQQEKWWTHCGDAAEFLGAAGYRETIEAGKDFVEILRKDTGIVSDREWADYLKALDIKSGPTAYIFRCRRCGKIGGYSDCT